MTADRDAKRELAIHTIIADRDRGKHHGMQQARAEMCLMPEARQRPRRLTPRPSPNPTLDRTSRTVRTLT